MEVGERCLHMRPAVCAHEIRTILGVKMQAKGRATAFLEKELLKNHLECTPPTLPKTPCPPALQVRCDDDAHVPLEPPQEVDHVKGGVAGANLPEGPRRLALSEQRVGGVLLGRGEQGKG
jgi:hypothetical protein